MICPRCGFGCIDKPRLLICSGCGIEIHNEPFAEWNLPDAKPPMKKHGVLCQKCNEQYGFEFKNSLVFQFVESKARY